MSGCSKEKGPLRWAALPWRIPVAVHETHPIRRGSRRIVSNLRLIAFADVDGQLHVERRAFVEMADEEVGVGDLDVG